MQCARRILQKQYNGFHCMHKGLVLLHQWWLELLETFHLAHIKIRLHQVHLRHKHCALWENGKASINFTRYKNIVFDLVEQHKAYIEDTQVIVRIVHKVWFFVIHGLPQKMFKFCNFYTYIVVQNSSGAIKIVHQRIPARFTLKLLDIYLYKLDNSNACVQ